MTIVAIGLNKTATRSMQAVFKKLGYRCLHNTREFSREAYKRLQNKKDIMSVIPYDFLSDIWCPPSTQNVDEYLKTQEFRERVCQQLAKEDVRFIINKRAKVTWLESRKYHGKSLTATVNIYFERNKEAMLKEYDDHYAFLDKFVVGKDCLWLDVCGGDSIDKLFEWLKVEPVMKEFPVVGKNERIK